MMMMTVAVIISICWTTSLSTFSSVAAITRTRSYAPQQRQQQQQQATAAAAVKCCDGVFSQKPRSDHWQAAVREAAFHALTQRSAFDGVSLDARVERDRRLWTRVWAAAFVGNDYPDTLDSVTSVRAGSLIDDGDTNTDGRLQFKVTDNYDCPDTRTSGQVQVLAAWRIRRQVAPNYGFTVFVKTGENHNSNNQPTTNLCTEDTYRFTSQEGLSHVGAKYMPRTGLVYHYTVDSGGGRREQGSQGQQHAGADRRILKPVKFPATGTTHPNKKLLYDAATGKVVISSKADYTNPLPLPAPTLITIEPRKRYTNKLDTPKVYTRQDVEREFITHEKYDGFLPITRQHLQHQAVNNIVLPTPAANHRELIKIYQNTPTVASKPPPYFRPSKQYTIYSEPDPLYEDPLYTLKNNENIPDKVVVIHRYPDSINSQLPAVVTEKQSPVTPVIPFISVTVSNRIPVQSVKQNGAAITNPTTTTTETVSTTKNRSETTQADVEEITVTTTTTVQPVKPTKTTDTDAPSSETFGTTTLSSTEKQYTNNQTLYEQMMTNDNAQQMRNIIKKDTTIASRGIQLENKMADENDVSTMAPIASTAGPEVQTTVLTQIINDTNDLSSKLIEDFMRTVMGDGNFTTTNQEEANNSQSRAVEEHTFVLDDGNFKTTNGEEANNSQSRVGEERTFLLDTVTNVDNLTQFNNENIKKDNQTQFVDQLDTGNVSIINNNNNSNITNPKTSVNSVENISDLKQVISDSDLTLVTVSEGPPRTTLLTRINTESTLPATITISSSIESESTLGSTVLKSVQNSGETTTEIDRNSFTDVVTSKSITGNDRSSRNGRADTEMEASTERLSTIEIDQMKSINGIDRLSRNERAETEIETSTARLSTTDIDQSKSINGDERLSQNGPDETDIETSTPPLLSTTEVDLSKSMYRFNVDQSRSINGIDISSRNGRAEIEIETSTEVTTTPPTTVTSFIEDHGSREITPQDLETASRNLASLLASLTFNLFNNQSEASILRRVTSGAGRGGRPFIKFVSPFNTTDEYDYDDVDDGVEFEEDSEEEGEVEEEEEVFDYDSEPNASNIKNLLRVNSTDSHEIDNSTSTKSRTVIQSNSH